MYASMRQVTLRRALTAVVAFSCFLAGVSTLSNADDMPATIAIIYIALVVISMVGVLMRQNVTGLIYAIVGGYLVGLIIGMVGGGIIVLVMFS
jgi:hypothetical protein